MTGCTRPMIGVTCGFDRSQDRYFTHEAEVQALQELGALPVLLPYTDEAADDAFWDVLDGLLLTGGQDCDPALYGAPSHPAIRRDVPERDAYELRMIEGTLKRGVPTLGICRGMQLLNVAQGGTLHTHTLTNLPHVQDHRDGTPLEALCHNIQALSGTWMARVAGLRMISVNSLHHQAVRDLGRGFVASAVSMDGLVEAIEYPSHRFMVGLQWHPERIWRIEAASRKVLSAFVAASAGYASDRLTESAPESSSRSTDQHAVAF